MKVVVFCGGLGTRLREHSDTIPKALVTIGYRPILWHLMRYYAHHGHKDFILCLGYRGDLIREYFLNYDERMSNDFTLKNLGGGVGKPGVRVALKRVGRLEHNLRRHRTA
jgi:glucose-1-phosphate cytidylyltransferase